MRIAVMGSGGVGGFYGGMLSRADEEVTFTASGTYRLGWIGNTLFKKASENGLSSVKKHMKEEGENLKRILETRSDER